MISKLGLIFECDAGGPDELVFRCFLKRLAPDLKVLTRAMGNKDALSQKSAEVAETLIDQNDCDLVLIVWDLKPLWDEPGNCKTEAADMRKSLEAISESKRDKIKLLCITYELETWLISDQAAVRSYFSRPSHPCKWKSSTKADKVTDPKATLISLSTKTRGRRYEDFREAIRLAREIKTTSKLLKVPSFKRFCQLVLNDDKPDFLQDGTACKEFSHGASQMGK